VVRPRDWSTYGERVKTDGRDAGALCSSLDRHLAGNRGALAVVRVPTEAEEAARSVSRQRQSLVRDRVRFTLRGKGVARLRGVALPKEWWRERIFARLDLPPDLREQLTAIRRVILAIEAEAAALTAQIEASAPAHLPAYLGAITWELLHRALTATGTASATVARWPATPDSARASIPRARRGCRAASTATVILACAICWWRPLGGSCAVSPPTAR